MRNYNSKAHIKPVSQNSFRKSDRKYPSPRKLGQSLSKDFSQKSKQPSISNNIKPQTTKQTAHNHHPIFGGGHLSQTYFLLLQQPANVADRNSNISQIDPQCLWFKNIQRDPTNDKLYIKFKSTQYIIGQWTNDQYPHLFFVTIDGILGYADQNGKHTNRVLALKLRQIQPYVDSNGIQVYQLRYTSTNETCWQIPSDMTHIRIGMKQDDSPVPMTFPLTNPIVIQFELKSQ